MSEPPEIGTARNGLGLNWLHVQTKVKTMTHMLQRLKLKPTVIKEDSAESRITGMLAMRRQLNTVKQELLAVAFMTGQAAGATNEAVKHLEVIHNFYAGTSGGQGAEARPQEAAAGEEDDDEEEDDEEEDYAPQEDPEEVSSGHNTMGGLCPTYKRVDEPDRGAPVVFDERPLRYGYTLVCYTDGSRYIRTPLGSYVAYGPNRLYDRDGQQRIELVTGPKRGREGLDEIMRDLEEQGLKPHLDEDNYIWILAPDGETYVRFDEPEDAPPAKRMYDSGIHPLPPDDNARPAFEIRRPIGIEPVHDESARWGPPAQGSGGGEEWSWPAMVQQYQARQPRTPMFGDSESKVESVEASQYSIGEDGQERAHAPPAEEALQNARAYTRARTPHEMISRLIHQLRVFNNPAVRYFAATLRIPKIIAAIPAQEFETYARTAGNVVYIRTWHKPAGLHGRLADFVTVVFDNQGAEFRFAAPGPNGESSFSAPAAALFDRIRDQPSVLDFRMEIPGEVERFRELLQVVMRRELDLVNVSITPSPTGGYHVRGKKKA